MLQKEKLSFEQVEKKICETFSTTSLAFSSATLGYHCLLSGVISKDSELVNYSESEGPFDHYTLLRMSVIGVPNIKVTEILLQKGANVNFTTNLVINHPHDFFYTESIIDLACDYQRYDMLELLISYGAKANTAVYMKLQNCEKLLESGIDMTITDDYGNTILHFAAKTSSKDNPEIAEVIELLVKYGLNINARNKNEQTPLHFACEYGMIENVQKLLELGADVNVKDDKGKHLLDYCYLSSLDILSILVQFDFDLTKVVQTVLKNGRVGIKDLKKLFEMGVSMDAVDDQNNTLLHYVIDVDAIEFLLSHNININAQNKDGLTPFHNACKFERIDIVKKLLELGANVNQTNNLLDYVSENWDLIELLLDYDFDIKSQTTKGETLLHIACKFGKKDKTIEFLQKSDITVDNDGNTVLHYAVNEYIKNIEIIEMLVREYMFDVDAQNHNGKTPLHVACEIGVIQNVRKLIELGATTTDNTLIHSTVEPFYDNVKVIKLIARCGVDINALNSEHQTALEIAWRRSNIKNVSKLLELGAKVSAIDNISDCIQSTQVGLSILILLIENGLDVDIRNTKGQTPLQIACELSEIDAIEKLLELNANVNVEDDQNLNMLDYARIPWNCWKVIFLLLEHGLDINTQRYNDGQTALHVACEFGETEKIEKLLEMGADVNVVDDEGDNLFYYIRDSENPWDGIFLLLQYGLDINTRDKKGRTLLHFACECEEIENVEKLLKKKIEVEAKDDSGRNVLDYIFGRKPVDLQTMWNIFYLLIDVDFDIDTPNSQGQTPLQIACLFRQITHVKKLRRLRANFQIVDKAGNNCLHSAVDTDLENVEVIELLYNQGVDINAKNEKGQTPLLVACQHGVLENVQMLLKLKADVNVKDNDDKNALDYVNESEKSQKRAEILNLLMDYDVLL